MHAHSIWDRAQIRHEKTPRQPGHRGVFQRGEAAQASQTLSDAAIFSAEMP